MSLKRHNPKRDANEGAIVKALREAGAMVTLLNGAGVPDLLVLYGGNVYLLEVKNKTIKYTDDQVKWHLEARKHDAYHEYIHTVLTSDEAKQAIGSTDG